MIFFRWVEYPQMHVCIHRTTDNGFFCSKYVGGKKVMGVTREFKTKQELSSFLLKQPNAPIDFINDMINSIE